MDWWLILQIVALGWGVNLITTLVSTISDMYWGNTGMAQGAISCLAFSWVPYAVFVAAVIHFTKWVLAGRP
jgi:hypothetical protein